MRTALGLAFVIMIGGCAQSERSPAESTPTKSETRSQADNCVVTPTIQSPAPENTEGGPPSANVHRWHVNGDRSIWMFDLDQWVAGERNKVAWFRPARTKLDVSGRRLDGEAPPLFVETSKTGDEYRHKFQPSIMIFPTEGCWEITAKAAQSEARFVIKVTGGSARADVD